MKSRGSSASSSCVSSATVRRMNAGLTAASATPPTISSAAFKPLSAILMRNETSLRFWRCRTQFPFIGESFLRHVLMQQLVHVAVSAELGLFQRGHAMFICSVDTCTRLNEYPRCTNLILLLLGTIRAVPMHVPEQRGRSELRAPCLNVGVMCDQVFDG